MTIISGFSLKITVNKVQTKQNITKRMYKAYVYKEIECKEIYLTHIKDSKFVCMWNEIFWSS